MRSYYSGYSNIMIPRTTPCVKKLIIANVLCWFFLVLVFQKYILQTLAVFHIFGFVPSDISEKLYLWQFVTYMFIHSDGMFHILFNMLVLWMFGSELEQLWRTRFFLIYYFVCGIGSVLVYFLCVKIYVILGGVQTDILNIPVVGASGAIFGLLLAYGWIFGERLVLFMLFIPMKARTFTLLIAGMELLSVVSSGFGSSVANLSHLGGLISGFLFLMLRRYWHRIQVKEHQPFSFFQRKKPNSFIKVVPNGSSFSEEE